MFLLGFELKVYSVTKLIFMNYTSQPHIFHLLLLLTQRYFDPIVRKHKAN